MPKVIYIDFNDCSGKYPNSVENGDAFFTYGFGGLYSQEFKKYTKEWSVECWKADSRIANIHEKNILGVQFRVFPAINLKKLGFISFQMAKEIRKENPIDLLINISSGRHLLFYQIAPLCKNIPLIIQHHGETTSIFDFKHRKGTLSKIRSLLTLIPEFIAFKSVNHYFVLDERLIDYLPRSFKGTYSNQTTGVDPEIFQPIDKLTAKSALKLDLAKRYILYVGRIGDHKRFDILLTVYKELKKEMNNIQLLVAGNRSGDKYENAASQAGVIEYGVVKQSELSTYLSAADVYVLPGYKSVHTFGGVGMLPLQAALCNTPIVGTSLKTVKPEIADKIGVCIKTENELKEGIINVLDGLYQNQNLRDVIIEEYSWSNISLKTKILYMKLIGKK